MTQNSQNKLSETQQVGNPVLESLRYLLIFDPLAQKYSKFLLRETQLSGKLNNTKIRNSDNSYSALLTEIF